jgi:hypothetical protein
MSPKAPADRILDTVQEVLRSEEGAGSGATFIRGLTLGALLGAAIAGSALWQRRVRSKRPLPSDANDQSELTRG